MDFWKKLKGRTDRHRRVADDSSDTLVYRFERMDNEIKYGAKLVVREGQSAVFVDQGKVADVFTPGLYTLNTQNIPILATPAAGSTALSPVQAEVYFVNTRQFTDRKWGTANLIMLRDAEFGPVRLRAFGTYAFKAADPPRSFARYRAPEAATADRITEQLRNFIPHLLLRCSASPVPLHRPCEQLRRAFVADRQQDQAPIQDLRA